MSVPRNRLSDEIRDVMEQARAQEAADLPTTEEVHAALEPADPTHSPGMGSVGLDAAVEPTDPDRDTLPEDGAAMDEHELQSVLAKEREKSIGGQDESELAGALAMAMDYYFGRKPAAKKAGRSKVISADLADMTEALLAEILPTFTQDLSVEFDSATEQDEATAQQESDLCNRVIQQDNQGYILWYALIKNALLQKNCVAKVRVEERETFIREYHARLDPLTIGQLLQPRQEGEVVQVEEQQEVQPAQPGDRDIPPQLMAHPQAQQLLRRFAVTIRRTFTRRRIVIDVVPMAELRVQGSHNSIQLAECGYVCHERPVPASELVEQGYDPAIIDELPSVSSPHGDLALSSSQTSHENDNYEAHHSTRPILVRENWVRVDWDGDGIAELREVVEAGGSFGGAGGGRILRNREMPFNLFASGTAFIMPNRWLGLSLFDKLKQTQDSKTDFLRQAHDNARTANHSTLGYVVGQAKASDIFNRKPGGGIALRRKDALVPVPHTDVLPSIFSMLGYEDKMRTERAGAALDMHSEALPVGAETAHGTERLATAKEMLAAMITETIAETVVRDVYLLVHKVLREQFSGPQSYKTSKGWETTDPAQWPVRDNITVNRGKSVGERNRQLAVLSKVGQDQAVALQTFGPGVLTDAGKIYNANVDYVRMSGLESATQYWIDPESPEAIQAARIHQANMEQAQQKQEQQAMMLAQLQQSLVGMQEETKRMKASMDHMMDRMQLAEDRRQHIEDSATEITSLELEHARDVSNQQAENRGE